MQLPEKHPTVDLLVHEEPEIDTEETPINIWKAIKFTIADINVEVTATFTIPENSNIQQLNQNQITICVCFSCTFRYNISSVAQPFDVMLFL